MYQYLNMLPLLEVELFLSALKTVWWFSPVVPNLRVGNSTHKALGSRIIKGAVLASGL